MVGRSRQLISVVLAASLVFMSFPVAAFADILKLDEDAITSSTNPGAVDDYSSVWREGWGNKPLAQFEIRIPQPNPGQPAITGGYYYVNRPGSLPATINAGLWSQAYWSPVTSKSLWSLPIDLMSEVTNPGPLFDTVWPAPVVPARAYEGPFATYFQFVAKDTTDAASAFFYYGLDVTPPEKVTGLQAIPGVGVMSATGWLTQSRVILKWDDTVYDAFSGTGYFEAFLDGSPYSVSQADPTSRRVYDLKEHYPGYGMTINTKREMVIEDLPAGTHTLQIRAVDRGTNDGPLSDPVTIQVDPDIPTIAFTAPAENGETMGAMPTFKANVTDAGGVAEVGFSVDGSLIGTDLVAPYSRTADLSAFADGSTHTVRVTAVDMAGRTNFAERTFVLDKKPQLTVLSPSIASEKFPSLVPLKISYTDKTGVTSIVFRVDGAVVASIVPSSVDATGGVATVLANAAVGAHTMSVTVTNDAGGVAVGNGSFVVDPPTRPDLSKYAPSLMAPVPAPNWFNTQYPTFDAVDTGSVSNPTEVLYLVDRAPMTTVDPTDPNAAYASFSTISGTTYFGGVIDQNGVYLSNPALFDGATQFAGVGPTEGIWYTHAMARNAAGQGGDTITTVYGVDLTAPAAVSGIAVYRDISTPAVGWLQQTRAIIKWTGAELDALSGTSAYRVYVDGTPLQGTIAYQPGRATMSLTLEDLTPGAHTVQVTAVDRAGNEGPKGDGVVVRVFSTPVAVITSPASVDATLSTPAPLRATVTDGAGIASVVFEVDGITVKTFTPPSGTTVLYCSSYTPLVTGTHVFRVTATSLSGPSTVVSRQFKVDASLPPEVDPPGGGGGGGGGGIPSVTPAFVWFNTPYPTFSARPSTVPTDPTELLYLVDRTPVTPIDPTLPNLYNGSFNPVEGTTYFNGTIDQNGVYLSEPLAFDGFLQMPGRVSSPIEGIWYIHALARNALGEGSPVAHVAYGVDLTAPVKVNGLSLYSSATALTPIVGWSPQSRVVVRWEGAERDALSGTAFYRVTVDGKPLGTDGSITFQPGRAIMSATIEDLTQGTHTIKVSAVDRAGNEGAVSETVLRCDLDVPTNRIVSPEGSMIGLNPILAVDANDGAGISSVAYYLNGIYIGSSSSGAPRFSLNPNLSGFAAGTYLLTATATDMVGRTADASKIVTLDRTRLTLTKFSRTPTLFYPIKRDRYKDNSTIYYTVNKTSTVTLTIRNSSGKVVRTLTSRVNAGKRKFVWDGKWAEDNTAHTGKFTYQITANDAASYSASTGKLSTTIRNYELRRISKSRVRVIRR